MIKLLIASLGVVPLFAVHTPNQTNAFLYGADVVSYNIEMYDDEDSFEDDYLISLPSVYNGALDDYNLGQTYYGNNGPNQQYFNTDVLSGMYFESYQSVTIKGYDFYLSLNNVSNQSFHFLMGGDLIDDITYNIIVEYDYIIPGWTDGASIFYSVQRSDSINFNGTTSWGYIYPFQYLVDRLPSYSQEEWFNIIHIKSFTCNAMAYCESEYSDFVDLYINDSYTYTNYQLSFSEDYLEELNDEYYLDAIPPYDMVGWLSESLNGLWSMQVIPGMSLGSIVLAVVAIFMMIVFIRLFAGG